jgi:hypothetical protein
MRLSIKLCNCHSQNQRGSHQIIGAALIASEHFVHPVAFFEITLAYSQKF